MHLEEEPLARHFPGAEKLLGTHSKGTCPSNSVAGEEWCFCKQTGESSVHCQTSAAMVVYKMKSRTTTDILFLTYEFK